MNTSLLIMQIYFFRPSMDLCLKFIVEFMISFIKISFEIHPVLERSNNDRLKCHAMSGIEKQKHSRIVDECKKDVKITLKHCMID